MPGNMVTQKRVVPIPCPPFRETKADGTILETAFSPLAGQQTTTSFRSGVGIQETVGSMLRENAQRVRQPFDTGHEFSTITNRLGGRIATLTRSSVTDGRVRSQAILPTIVSGSGKNFETIPDWTDYAAIGNKFIKSTAPTSPAADTITNLAEILREGIPQAPGAIFGKIRPGDNPVRLIGEEFLNLAFGLKPAVQGVLDIVDAVKESEKILKQYRADSGRIVRRRRLLDPEVTVQRFAPVTSGFYTLSGYPLHAVQAQVTRTRTTSIQYSFSAAYTYHLAQGDSLVSSVERFSQEANRLFGLRFTPEVLYNLTPWSWLVDWFANVGDNIAVANAFSNDQLVLKYGYVMKKTIIINTYTTPPIPIYKRETAPPVNISFYTIKKERKRATPFGFGLSTSEFTPEQWSILVALGMSKSPGSLR